MMRTMVGPFRLIEQTHSSRRGAASMCDQAVKVHEPEGRRVAADLICDQTLVDRTPGAQRSGVYGRPAAHDYTGEVERRFWPRGKAGPQGSCASDRSPKGRDAAGGSTASVASRESAWRRAMRADRRPQHSEGFQAFAVAGRAKSHAVKVSRVRMVRLVSLLVMRSV